MLLELMFTSSTLVGKSFVSHITKTIKRRRNAARQLAVNCPDDNLKQERTDFDDDCFVGVLRKRNKIKNFFVSGISTSVNEKQITRYLQKRDITPTYISTFQSKRKGTISSKIHIPAATSLLVLKDDFWPPYVTCQSFSK